MSEWEDFCESSGISNTEEGNEFFINSLVADDESPRPKHQSPCHLNQQEVDALLARTPQDCFQKPDLNLYWWAGGNSDFFCDSVDGFTAETDKTLIVEFSDGNQEWCGDFSYLVENLRTTGLPLSVNYFNRYQVLIWDMKFQCINSWRWNGLEPDSKRVLKLGKNPPPSVPVPDDLLHLLDRAKGAEHALKPLLVAATDVERAKSGQIIEFLEPSALTIEELRECHLVYVNSKGVPVSVPLTHVDTFVRFIYTRNGTYSIWGGMVRSFNGPARLTTGAFRMSKISYHPIVRYFLRATHGTIYQPVFRRISPLEINGYDPGSVYVTQGNHPLEEGGTNEFPWLTTTLHYQQHFKS